MTAIIYPIHDLLEGVRGLVPGTIAEGSPTHGAAAGYLRGVSVRIQYLGVPEAGGLEPDHQHVSKVV